MARHRTSLAVLITALALALPGCTSSSTPDEDPSPSAAAPEQQVDPQQRTATLSWDGQTATLLWDVCSSDDETSMTATGAVDGGGAASAAISGGTGTVDLPDGVTAQITTFAIDAAGAFTGAGRVGEADATFAGRCQL